MVAVWGPLVVLTFLLPLGCLGLQLKLAGTGEIGSKYEVLIRDLSARTFTKRDVIKRFGIPERESNSRDLNQIIESAQPGYGRFDSDCQSCYVYVVDHGSLPMTSPRYTYFVIGFDRQDNVCAATKGWH